MQISSALSQLNSVHNDFSLQQLTYEKFQHERTELTGVSSDNNSVILSISESSMYSESLYTAEGIFDSSPRNTVIPSSNNTGIEKNTSKPDSTAFAIIEEENSEKYYALIAKIVENLQKTLSQERSPLLNTANIDGTEILSKAHKEQPVNGYAIYSQQTITQYQNITIEISSIDSDYFSPEKTAQRIIDFALSFYNGGDRQEYAAMIRKAVMKGYNEAMEAFGGFLPQESHETIAIVNKAIDDFANSKDIALSA